MPGAGKFHVNINASSEADADTIAREVSRLPMFNATLETPFHDIMVRKQIARVIDGILFPAIFVAVFGSLFDSCASVK